MVESVYNNRVLVVDEYKDSLTVEEIEKLLSDNWKFSKMNYDLKAIAGNKELKLIIGYNTEDDLKLLRDAKLIIDTKNEDEEEITLISLDKFLEYVYDWYECIVSFDNMRSIGYKYIIQCRVGDCELYLTFLKGVIYSTLVDYMYACFIDNVDIANEAAELLQDIDENAKVRDIESSEAKVMESHPNTPEELAEYNFSTEESNN